MEVREFTVALGVIFVVLVGYSVPAHCAEKQCKKDEPTKCAIGLKEGDLAPFSGQLLTPDLTIELGQAPVKLLEKHNAEIQMMNMKSGIDIALTKEKARIQKEGDDAKIKALQDALEGAQTPFYKEPAFVIPITVAVTVGAILGAIAVSAELGKATWGNASPR